VALSGDGGDELFAGYNRYLWAERFLRVADALPQRLHHPMAAALRTLPPDTWTRLFSWLPFVPRTALAGDKLHKIATLLECVPRDNLPPAGQPMATAGRDRDRRARTRGAVGGCDHSRRFPGSRVAHAVSRSRYVPSR
jgi:hypothetical protein